MILPYRSLAQADTTILYVAAKAKPGRADGSISHPFTSLEAARMAIRQIKRHHDGSLPPNGIIVRLRSGYYELPSGFLLGPQDAGSAAAPIIYSAAPGETVILSGGKRLPAGSAIPALSTSVGASPGTVTDPAVRVIDLRSLGITDYGTNNITGFRRPYVNAAMELFINGQPYHLARYPNDHNIQLDTNDVVDNGLSPDRRKDDTHPGKIRFDKHRLARWAHAPHIMAAGNFTYSWATDQLRIGSIDTATGVVSFADAHPFGITGGHEWTQYYFFNLLEELDQPGEYYIDHRRGKLYFYPLQPLRPTDTLEVSLLEDALVSLEGTSHIHFRNLIVDAGRGIGIYMEKDTSCTIESSTIRNMGVVGICIGRGSDPEKQHRLPDPLHPHLADRPLSGRLGSLHELLYENTVFDRQGGKDNGVIACTIENTGCGGISLGGGDRITLTPAGNYVDDCLFINCGRVDYSYKAPVNIDGVGNTIRHCQFTTCPATAIYLHGNNHLIEYNSISEACRFIDDQGAIYMGRDPSEAGNIIRYNFFRDIGHFGLTMAVYFDDGACGSQVYGNVFYKAGSRTVLVGGGSYNHVFNNIFIDCPMALHLDDRLANWSGHVLDSGGLFALRLRAVGYDRAPYAKAYPWLAGYFLHHPELPQYNDFENNVLVNVKEMHNGNAAWGPIHDDNKMSANDPRFVDSVLANNPYAARQASTSSRPAGRNQLSTLPQPFVAHDTGWKRLSLRQKIGQTMLMLPDRDLELTLGDGSLRRYFKRYPVSGFFMGWKLWTGVKPGEKLAHIRLRCAEYQQNSELPLVFQEDYESGIDLPGMVSFPNEMTLGAAGSPALAYAYGAAVAKECESIGVRWVLHPVADLNVNPLNPIMNVRSIGDDADNAIRLLSQQIKGLQDNGVAATIKHFPGDGVDSRDQHLLTTSNSLPMAEWRQKHGKVFQALIDSGVACIMPGHITLPAWQHEKINGFYPPATLSKELLTDLLKGEMGFKGVIVSDAMTMGGFRGYYDDPLEGEVHSFMAGVDVLLWPSYRFMDTVEARILRGEIPMARLDDAVSRVWAMKERFGLLDSDRPLLRPMTAEERSAAAATADSICDAAVTLVRDRGHALPLRLARDKRILVVGVAPVGRKGGSIQLDGIKAFAQELRDRGFTVDFRHDILYETQGWTEDAPSKYDRIIFVVARSPHTPFGPMQLWDDEAQSIWAANAMPKEKLIVVSLGSPYMVNEYFERVNTCINAYSNTPVMRKAVVRALLGEIPMKGISPVRLGAPDPDTLSILRELRPRRGLPNVFAKLKAGQPVTIVYLGGSITQAANGYRQQSAAWLQAQYPAAKIMAINAGVGGTRSDLGAFRLKSQVLDQNPDLVFVEFAVNDMNTDTTMIHEAMEGIVRRIRANDPATDICFVYTMMGAMAEVLSQDRLPPGARAMEDVAEYYQIPSIDMCVQIMELYKAGSLIFQGKPGDHPDKSGDHPATLVFSPDNVHPYPETGHRLYTEAIARSFLQMSGPDQGQASAAPADVPHPLPPPMTPDRLEHVQMVPADKLTTTGQWTVVQPSGEGEGVLSPEPFSTLLKTTRPGSALVVNFDGTMIGLYDVIGPGTGTWEVWLDGKRDTAFTRFDAFATYWRPHYVLLTDLPPGRHRVEFRLSADVPDKQTLLGANANDYTAHPDKYREAAGYAGYLLLAGKLMNSSN
jgi:beta-N-acetylhexosaminidase